MLNIKAKQFGSEAEKAVAKHYAKNGYKILYQNFRTRQGEIDVIAQKGDYVVFIEVKARSENSIALPQEFVTPQKQRKIIAAAKAFISLINEEPFLRFDVVAVEQKNKKYVLTCFENAFQCY